jgi:recombination protein RecA
MAVQGTSIKEVLASMRKKHGDTVGMIGGKIPDVARLPTGIFAFDLASGGGLPRGKCSTIFGPESSGKTNMALRAIAQHQKLYPDKLCVFISIEGYDQPWSKQMGVDVDRLVLMRPSYAEQAVDMIIAFLNADDVGVVVLDSIAAMITTAEDEKSADQAIVGGNSIVVGKMVRKSTLALESAAKHGRYPVLIYINQTRFKIGVMFGNPETTPGGNAPLFQAAMRIRLYGKNKIDNKISKVMPVIKETQFVLNKWKVPVLAPSGRFDMVMIPHDGFACGECDDVGTVSHYLKHLGVWEKAKNGWMICEELYPTQQAFVDRYRSENGWADEIKGAIIACGRPRSRYRET